MRHQTQSLLLHLQPLPPSKVHLPTPVTLYYRHSTEAPRHSDTGILHVTIAPEDADVSHTQHVRALWLHADPFAALEGLSHPFDAAPAPAAPGIDLDALYGGVTAPQPRAVPLSGILDSLGAAVSSQQPPVDPFADPFAPPAQYQTTANLMGARRLFLVDCSSSKTVLSQLIILPVGSVFSKHGS